MDRPFTLTRDEALKLFDVKLDKGLSHKQVEENRAKYGKNELPEDEPVPLWQLVLEQFKDNLVIMLLMAAAVSFALAVLETQEKHERGEEPDYLTSFVEPVVILLILIANAFVGVIQEMNAEKAIEALKQYSPDEAKVLRNGHLQKVNAVELVPGDIIDIAIGDKIPADCRLLRITSSAFRIDQALLTGESVSVNKITEPISDPGAVKQDQINMLFSGTTVVIGKARALVIKTGSETAIGDIHKSITSQISEKTPLKKKLDDFGDDLAKVITIVCIAVWLINIRHFNDPSHHGWLKGAVYYFKIAVALAVAAIPEGLAVVITTCLALGTKKMAKRNAIVRSLPSVETLGCTSVICSDKTGTLTTNQMSVCRMLVVESAAGAVSEYRVEGSSYSPHGDIKNSLDETVTELPVTHKVMNQVAQICSICNDASISLEGDHYRNVGEPTEAALRVLVEKMGTEDPAYNRQLSDMNAEDRVDACNRFYENKFQKLATLEFTRDRKSMSVLVVPIDSSTAPGTPAKRRTRSSSRDPQVGVLLVKGAPEAILERCTHVRLASGREATTTKITSQVRTVITNKILEYGETESLRCLGLAVLENCDMDILNWDLSDSAQFAKIERDMTFVGLVGMLDPPRPEVRRSIANCMTAGIRVIVITGDNKNTAESICRKVGVFGEREDLTGRSYTGREFDAMSDDEKLRAVKRADLFSRTEPTHKSKLVDLLQSLGHVVAMTGDGVNDAPALKKADIGVAMGSGTDVAKLAADMVLADDNFTSIEGAVEEGRAIYNNTKQFIRYLISSNIGEVVSIFLTVLLGMPEALIPVQLLWVNLVTDGLPATALGFNPPDHAIMKQPPRSAKEPIVGRWLYFRYLVVGGYVGAATVFGYAWWFMYYQGGPGITFHQLTNFHKCHDLFPEIGCDMFTSLSARRATTMSLSILVTIEMFNAMNSLSENESLLTLPVWANPALCFAIVLSLALHFMILYVPFFSTMFAIVPLNWEEWQAVLWMSLPVILIDELLKLVSRTFVAPGSIPAKDKSQ